MGNIDLLIKSIGEERIKLSEKLSFYTYHKSGGLAEYFFVATNRRELINILNLCLELKIPFFIFGNGTKIMISDAGIKGLVIRNRASSMKITGIKGKVGSFGVGVDAANIEIDSGAKLGSINEFLHKQRLRKVDWSSTNSGTIGGSIFLDPEIQSRVEKVQVWNFGEIEEINIKELSRKSHIILSVMMKFKA